MEMNDSNRKNRLLVTDPAIVALMVEGSAMSEILKKVKNTVAAVDDANPDLAIAMWQRCNQHVKEAAAGLQLANAELARLPRFGVNLDPFHVDAAIETLETTAPALYPIGRYLAYTGIQIAFACARFENRRATMVMKGFLRNLEDQKAALTRELNRRLQLEVERHVEGGGARPEGQCSVMTAEKLGDPAYIVFEKSA